MRRSPTRSSRSRAASSAIAPSTPTASPAWPRSRRARSCWPSWPVGCRRRWASSPGCSPHRCATWARSWRRSPSRSAASRPRRDDPSPRDHPSPDDPLTRRLPMATALSQDDLLEAIDKMTILELSEFIKKFEERYGVTAAAPVAVAAAPAAAAGGDGAAPAAGGGEEQSEFSAVLAEVGPNKIPVIKVVRELTGLGLKEAKDLVDAAPKPVKEGVNREEADKIKAALEEQGAKVEIK